jgi:hypothetical protein
MAEDYEVIGHDSLGNEIIEGEVIENMDDSPSDEWRYIAYHLQNNHYPPVPLNMVDTCLEAIERAGNGEWDSLITLPEKTSYKGEPHASVQVIVDSHHLHDFIKSDKDVITIKDPEGNIVYQGYGEPFTEPAADIDSDPEAYGIEK